MPEGKKSEVRQKKSLAAKMASVMSQLHRLPKNGWNQHHRYKFATDADVSDTIRSLLAAEGVAFLPQMTGHERVETEGKSHITRVHFTMRFLDTDSDDVLEATWISEAMDTQDKGLNKAATAAVKYFLLKTFLISTGDEPDPDADSASATGNGGPITEKQIAALRGAVQDAGRDWDRFLNYVLKEEGTELEELSSADASRLLGWVRDLAPKKSGVTELKEMMGEH